MKALLLGAMAVIALIAITQHDKGDKSSPSAAAAANAPHVSVIAEQSYCSATGDGKVVFVFALRNTGGAGTVSLTPVRHYSDGHINMADTMIDIPVSAHSIKRGSSLPMTYKADEHGIVSCGLEVDFGDEVPISV
jgi:hypothetical protein